MICPKCNTEYREAFVRCADCDVELVRAAPEVLLAPDLNHGVRPEDEDPFCEFWRGEDPRVHAELCGLLAEAAIRYRTAELQDHVFNRLRFPEFRIAIPFSTFERAEKLVDEAYGSEEAADSVMHPTEEYRPEFRRLIGLSFRDKFPPRGSGDGWKRGHLAPEDREEKQDEGELPREDR